MLTRVLSMWLTLMLLFAMISAQLRATEPKVVMPSELDDLVQGEYQGDVTKSNVKEKFGRT